MTTPEERVERQRAEGADIASAWEWARTHGLVQGTPSRGTYGWYRDGFLVSPEYARWEGLIAWARAERAREPIAMTPLPPDRSRPTPTSGR